MQARISNPVKSSEIRNAPCLQTDGSGCIVCRVVICKKTVNQETYMAYKMIKVPAGERVTADASGKLQVPDRPIIGFIEGDGIGPDITAASMRIWNQIGRASCRERV